MFSLGVRLYDCPYEDCLFSSEQVSDWFQETFTGLDLQEVASMCIREGVDGKMMDKIVSESDRDILAELDRKSVV